MKEIFASEDFGFSSETAGALARLYDYVFSGVSLRVSDMKVWLQRRVLDVDGRCVVMPGPLNSGITWILLGLIWENRLTYQHQCW